MSRASALIELRATFPVVESLPMIGYSMPSPYMPLGVSNPKDSPAWGPVAAFPFHTAVAQRVWDSAKKQIRKHPEAAPLEIIRLAVVDSKMSGQELTPEDYKLLEMAISWLQNGFAKPELPTGQPTMTRVDY